MVRVRRYRPGRTPHRPRQLRRTQTDAEARLWSELRNRQLEGFKFRRQYRVGPYITDFACAEVGLIIELDGGQHAQQEHYDRMRTRFLNYAGFEVMRFWNNEIHDELDAVLETIRVTCLERRAYLLCKEENRDGHE